MSDHNIKARSINIINKYISFNLLKLVSNRSINMGIPPVHQSDPSGDNSNRNSKKKFSFLNGKQHANVDQITNNRHCTPKANRAMITSEQNRDGRHSKLIDNRKQIRSAFIQDNRHIKPNLDTSRDSTVSNRSISIISSFKDKCVEAGISFLNNLKNNNNNSGTVSPIINLEAIGVEAMHSNQGCDEIFQTECEKMCVDDQNNNSINLEDPQNREHVKDANKYKVSFESRTSKQKAKFNLKFKGTNLNSFKEFKVLLEEIKRNKPNVHIQHANVVDRHNEAILYITTSDRRSYNELSSDWPIDAFKTGVSLVKNNLKYFVAIRGVSRKNKFDDKDELLYLKDEYGLLNFQRIFNKEKIESTIVKAEIESEIQMVNAVKHGVYINNYHHKVDLWTFSAKVCYKCQGFGHFAKECNIETCQVCKHCGGAHGFKECGERKKKEMIYCQACNIKNDHSSGDKKCPKLKIEYVKNNRSYASIVANNNLEAHTSRQILGSVKPVNNVINNRDNYKTSKIEVDKISDKNNFIDESIQIKVIKCIQDFFMHQTRLQDSFQQKDDSIVTKLFKRHFSTRVVDKCKNYINQSITNDNFYVQTAKSDDQDLATPNINEINPSKPSNSTESYTEGPQTSLPIQDQHENLQVENQDAYNDNQTQNVNHNSADNPIYLNVSKESSVQDAPNDQSTLQPSSQTRV